MYREYAEIFKILGVESRIRIIVLLREKGPSGVSEIAEELSVTASAVSQHLKILKYAGIVTCERKGYHVMYQVDADVLSKLMESLINFCSPEDTNGETKESLEQSLMD